MFKLVKLRMTKTKKTNQTQKSGANSTNLQVESLVVKNGLTYSEAKEIALDVFKSNFLELSKQASETALSRAEEITNNFLIALKDKELDSIETIKDPGFQYALYESQKQYAKTGDKDIADVLVDILVDRVENQKRNIKQIVLEESITIAPKLTSSQLDTLTLIFILRYTINNSLTNLEKLKEYLNTYITPFIDTLSKGETNFQHLEFAGCGNIQISTVNLVEVFKQNYSGLFCQGFSKEEFERQIGDFNKYGKMTIKSLYDSSKLQISFLNEDVLEKITETENFDQEVKNKLKTFFSNNLMSYAKIKEEVEKLGGIKIKNLLDIWEKSYMKNMTLTTVGISIAQANFRRKTGITLDLSNWIKD